MTEMAVNTSGCMGKNGSPSNKAMEDGKIEFKKRGWMRSDEARMKKKGGVERMEKYGVSNTSASPGVRAVNMDREKKKQRKARENQN